MPRVTVHLDPSLEDLLRPPRRGPLVAAAPPGATLLAVVEDLGIPGTEIGHLSVNGRPASPADLPSDGDDIAVEAVPGGHGPTPPRFLLDVHLGRLARLLRLLGFDAAWQRDADDAVLAGASAREDRILLSRDRGLLKRREVHRGCLVRSQTPRQQLEQVVERFGLRGVLAPFSRCLVCNTVLVRDAHPGDGAGAGSGESPTGACPSCGRRYWRGSHWAAMERLVEEIRRVG
jgi:uncharacterized protein with PIN domain